MNQAAIILCNAESSAHERVALAVIRTILGLEPDTGKVSWMIPITQALQASGIQAAYACYQEILNDPDYDFDAYDLITLAYQLVSAKKIDLAMDVLELNLYAFPEHRETAAMLTKLPNLKR